MIRTQIQLEENQYNRLRQLVSDRGISMAAIIRQWIDEKLEDSDGETSRSAVNRGALLVCGKYEDPVGCDRVAEDHDDVLAGAYEGEGRG